MMNKPLICITTGEPAGIGPEICLDLINSPFNKSHNLLLIGDINLLRKRARLLNKAVELIQLSLQQLPDFPKLKANQLPVLNLDCPQHECIGLPVAVNANYVLQILDTAITICQRGWSHSIVTAPVNKDILNTATLQFSGHTEYLAAKFKVKKVVMMLSNSYLNVALLTTHIPLSQVPQQVTATNLNQTLRIIHDSWRCQFNLTNPKIAVCGLNPHAGENGYLGAEEIDIINPLIRTWQQQGYNVFGSFPADTIFNRCHEFDVILAMYHDQGLPVVKYADFAHGVNVTLGLPIIRTSVDHGTALELAGSGQASSASLHAAVKFAINPRPHI